MKEEEDKVFIDETSTPVARESSGLEALKKHIESIKILIYHYFF